MGFRKLGAGILVAALIAALAVGCGGGSGSSEGSTSNSGNTTKSESSGSDSKKSSASEGSKSEPSTEFLGKGPNGKLATQGKEADAPEREAASKVIEENLQARAAGDWAAQCSSLAAHVVKEIEKASSILGASTGCVKALEAQAEPLPEAARANTMTGPIDVLRVNFNEGFAFYHGTEGKDYVIPLRKEGGEWKLEALKEAEVP